MKFVPEAVSRAVGKQILKGRKNSPTILFVGGVAGVVTSTVMACRATLKLEDVLEEVQKDVDLAKDLEHENYSEEDRKHDLAILYVRGAGKIAKLYGPAFVLGVTSIAALAGSHRILNKRNAALTAAYSAVSSAFAQYRQRVVDEYGEDKDQELRYGSIDRVVVEDTSKGPKKVNIKSFDPDAGESMYARVFDQLSSQWEPTPSINYYTIKQAERYANDRLRARGFLFLNEVYKMLDLRWSSEGQLVGWIYDKDNVDGDNYVDFGLGNVDDDSVRDFVQGREASVMLDFNVDGIIYDKI